MKSKISLSLTALVICTMGYAFLSPAPAPKLTFRERVAKETKGLSPSEAREVAKDMDEERRQGY